MAGKRKITIRLVDRKGTGVCHHGHQIGDTFDFDTDRGKICPMAMHVGFVYADILRYGGKMPRMKNGAITFCCPDADVINVFEISATDA